MSTFSIPAQCPQCRAVLRVRQSLLGRRVCCRYCGEVFTVVGSADGSPRSPETGNGSAAAAASSPASWNGDGPPAPQANGSVPHARGPWSWARGTAASGSNPLPGRAGEPHFRHRPPAMEPSLAMPDEPARAPESPAPAGATVSQPVIATSPPASLSVNELVAEAPECLAEPPPRDDSAMETLRAELDAVRAERDRAVALAESLEDRVRGLRAESRDLRQALSEASVRIEQSEAKRRLPVLVRDMERWKAVAAEDLVRRAIAVPVGPPALPPSLDDLETVEVYLEMLRRLLRTPAPSGKPFHTLFDAERFQLLQARVREAALMGDRLLNNVERSKSQKELLWHLMVAQRNEELRRRR